jgi:hypothetical protein
MTIDKIKHYMSEDLFNFWASGIPTKESKNKAYNDLKKDIEQGILTGIKYNAELKLLELIK